MAGGTVPRARRYIVVFGGQSEAIGQSSWSQQEPIRPCYLHACQASLRTERLPLLVLKLRPSDRRPLWRPGEEIPRLATPRTYIRILLRRHGRQITTLVAHQRRRRRRFIHERRYVGPLFRFRPRWRRACARGRRTVFCRFAGRRNGIDVKRLKGASHCGVFGCAWRVRSKKACFQWYWHGGSNCRRRCSGLVRDCLVSARRLAQRRGRSLLARLALFDFGIYCRCLDG